LPAPFTVNQTVDQKRTDRHNPAESQFSTLGSRASSWTTQSLKVDAVRRSARSKGDSKTGCAPFGPSDRAGFVSVREEWSVTDLLAVLRVRDIAQDRSG
jgi:hypothetical protein